MVERQGPWGKAHFFCRTLRVDIYPYRPSSRVGKRNAWVVQIRAFRASSVMLQSMQAANWLKKHGLKTTNPKGFKTLGEASDYFIMLRGMMLLDLGPREEIGDAVSEELSERLRGQASGGASDR